jgi:hypothetical protein
MFNIEGPAFLTRKAGPSYFWQDAQKGRPARPQQAKMRGVRFGTLSF